MKCTAHLLGLSWECRDEECTGEIVGETTSGDPHSDDDLGGEPSVSASTDSVSDDSDFVDSDDEDSHQTYKDDSSLKDQQSTGRKRAARWFPIDKSALCEWAGKTNCGGGKHPITGCVGNLQQARHHGPDKNTLNNEKGNVHRICHTCHNRWHTLNDHDYVWNIVHEKHDPAPASVDDFAANEKFWEGRKVVKAKD
ncbi:hypothetical protein [Streptomyces sp. NPDC048720]|uniref:hypothetical protein n=1 Tax=Streptomyces sp. NPDC048720 TaxID=3365588 RepID=UPI00371FBAF5